jgi:hypothetical protein
MIYLTPQLALNPSFKSSWLTSSDSGSGDGDFTHAASPRSLIQTQSPSATVAYAVPLSLAGVIVLFASVVCVHQRSKLLHERALAEEEFKSFQTMFRGGRWRSFTLWSTKPAHSVPECPTTPPDLEKEAEAEDIFTRPYIPHLSPRGSRPRRTTKEPFHTATTGHSMVPAGCFRSGLSPRISYSPLQSPSVSRIYSSQEADDSCKLNATVNDSVISNYLQPSPTLLTWHTEPPAPMQQAYIRRQIPPITVGRDMQNLYDEVARRLA